MLITGNRMFFSTFILESRLCYLARQLDLQDHVILKNPSCLAVCLWQNIQYSHLSMRNHWQLEMEAVVCLMSMRSNGETLV